MKKLIFVLIAILVSLTQILGQYTNTIELSASKSYNPEIYFDFDSTFSEDQIFIIPEYLIVTEGNAGSGMATLKFYSSQGDSVIFTYKGEVNNHNSNAPGQEKKGLKYTFFSSSNGFVAGNYVKSNQINLRINTGNSALGDTYIRAPLLFIPTDIDFGCGGSISYIQSCDKLIFNISQTPYYYITQWRVLTLEGGTYSGVYLEEVTGSSITLPISSLSTTASNYLIIVDLIDPTSDESIENLAPWCGGAQKYFTFSPIITVNATASPTTLLPCGGLTSSMLTAVPPSPTGNTYLWKNAGGSIIGNMQSINVSPTVTTTYSVEVTNSLGVCGSKEVTVYVFQPKIYPQGPGICPGQTMNLKLIDPPPPGLSNFQWYLNGVAIPGATGTSYNASVAGVYSISVTNSGTTCFSNNLTVNNLNVPVAPSFDISTLTRCGIGTLPISVLPPLEPTYQWYTQAVGGAPVANGSTYTPLLYTTTTFFVQARNSCGASSRTPVTATVINTLIVPNGPGICPGGSLTLTLNSPQAGQTYQWFLNGVPLAGQTQSSIAATIPGDYYLRVSQNGIDCNTNTRSVVLLNSTVTPTVENIYRCNSGSVTLAVTNVTGNNNYTWYDQPTGGNILAAVSSFTTTVTTTTTFYVQSNSFCGATSPRVPLTVFISGMSCCNNYFVNIASTFSSPILGQYGTITTIDASTYGGTVIFDGSYHVRGNLNLINGTFHLRPGTIFYMESLSGVFTYNTICLPTSGSNYDLVQIIVNNATFRMTGATLRATCDKLWGGVLVQNNSTIITERHNPSFTNSRIQDGYFGIFSTVFVPYAECGLPIQNTYTNTNLHYISNTQFFNNFHTSIVIHKKTNLIAGEQITNSTFTSDRTTMKSPFNGIFGLNGILANGDFSGIALSNNTFDNLLWGINFQGNNAIIENSTFRNLYTKAIDINSNTNQKNIIRNNSITIPNNYLTLGFYLNAANPVYGIVAGNATDILDNTIEGKNTNPVGNPNNKIQLGIVLELTNPSLNISKDILRNTIQKLDVGITMYESQTQKFDMRSNTFIGNVKSVEAWGNFYVIPTLNIAMRCNTFDKFQNAGAGLLYPTGNIYGIIANEFAYFDPLGNPTLPNGNAFTNVTYPMEYNDAASLSGFRYYKSTSPKEDIIVTHIQNPVAGAIIPTPGFQANCSGPPGVISGFKLAQSEPLSEEDSISTIMDSLRFQLGTFRQMKSWQRAIMEYHEKTNDIEGIEAYTDSLIGCNLEAYNSFMLYLMNKQDEGDHCSKAHQFAEELVAHNPDDAEIEARITYFNYTCRQRHGGGNAALVLPFMPLAIQDSISLAKVATSGTSLSETACMKLRMHNANMPCNSENSYKVSYPDCGPECAQKRRQFLRKGLEAATGLNMDKTGGQLAQNIPNPASGETLISYYIPEMNFESAYISIQNVINNSETIKMNLTESGYQGILINTDVFPSGVYVYTLVIDGIPQDSKRMVIVK